RTGRLHRLPIYTLSEATSNKLDSAATSAHKKHVSGDHWYLIGLGTHPDKQGLGIGSAVIEIGATKAAEAGLPVYLETMTQENVDYYSKRGFRVLEELVIDDKIKVWAMLRDPKNSH
ncbi:MAG: GNAT family N-acetyltransferase, partial [Chloroflexi bacterium]|nr:GNAT family N-acetyltransferase [Chloroflexota bacterium]